jgi:hypothetical protein
VRGRLGLEAVALWRVCDGDEVVVVYIVGRRADGRLRRDEGCGVVEVRRRADRDIAIDGMVLTMGM